MTVLRTNIFSNYQNEVLKTIRLRNSTHVKTTIKKLYREVPGNSYRTVRMKQGYSLPFCHSYSFHWICTVQNRITKVHRVINPKGWKGPERPKPSKEQRTGMVSSEATQLLGLPWPPLETDTLAGKGMFPVAMVTLRCPTDQLTEVTPTTM